MQYLHAACSSPTTSTWIQAINKNNFLTWPGLTQKLVKRHLPVTQATILGQIHRERQNLQSTKRSNLRQMSTGTSGNTTDPHNEQLEAISTAADHFPPPTATNQRVNQSIYSLVQDHEITKGYQDLAGRFPVCSSRGHEYILVGYHPDANYIHGIPVKNRTATVLTEAWQELHAIFSKAGTPPTLWVLDNEISGGLKRAFTRAETTYQLVPPHSHRRNQAERAIQTFKNHFKSGLASMDPTFPLSEWDRIIPQANLTLNLLRNAKCNPKLSAYSFIHGPFDFYATSLAPPGTKVISHIDTTQKGTWDLNGEVGWYVGPVLNHYRCVECYFPRTKTTRICDNIFFLPHSIPFPKITATGFLKQAMEDIIHILTQPQKPNVPTLESGDPIRAALQNLPRN